MNRNHPAPLLAVAAIAVLLGACSSNDVADTATAPKAAPPSSRPTTPSPDEPTDLIEVPEGTLLQAGKYLAPYLAGEGDRDPANSAMRGVVDVPGGYTGGGPVIESDHGDAAFWGKVTRVATDPCRGASRQIGPSVRDLATALAAQRHMSTTRPLPVTVGGYHGLYVKSYAPKILDHCRHQEVVIYTGGGSWLQTDLPGGAFRWWILDVGGQRVVAATRSLPDTADADPLNHMMESAEFTSVDEP